MKWHNAPIRMGVSSCLRGDAVRYDGKDKLHPFVAWLEGKCELVPVCPEFELGLGVPRPPMQLGQGQTGEKTRLMVTRSGQDLSAAMRSYVGLRIANLGQIDGFILKKGSPSCGLKEVPIYEDGQEVARGAGLFAQELQAKLPLLPVEQEVALDSPEQQENFLARVFSQRALRRLFESAWSAGDLVKFHSGYKLLLLAHSAESYRQLGHLVARAGSMAAAELRESYEAEFFAAFQAEATVGRHVNVLEHMLGYFRRRAPVPERQELAQNIADYAQGRIGLRAVRHQLYEAAVRLEIEYLTDQVYFAPVPAMFWRM